MKIRPLSICANITDYLDRSMIAWLTSTHTHLDACPSLRSLCLVLAVYSQSLQRMRSWVLRNQFHMRLSMMLGATRSQAQAICYRRSLHHAALSTTTSFEAEVDPAHRRRRTITYAPHLTLSIAIVSRDGPPGRRRRRPQ
jgi:hypothetical protein